MTRSLLHIPIAAQLFSSTGYEFPRKLYFSCSVRSPHERNKAVHNLLYPALMQRACHVHLFSRSSNTASKPVSFCREFCCKISYLEIVPKSCDLHNDTGSFRGKLLMFHSTEQQTLNARMEWFKFMMLTPRSSCKLCLCLWPSDSHDLLSQKMLLLSRPRSSSFLSLSQMLSSSQLITTWLLSLLMIHLLECFLIFGQLRVIMSSPGHHFPSSNQASKGDPPAPLFYSRKWGESRDCQDNHTKTISAVLFSTSPHA